MFFLYIHRVVQPLQINFWTSSSYMPPAKQDQSRPNQTRPNQTKSNQTKPNSASFSYPLFPQQSRIYYMSADLLIMDISYNWNHTIWQYVAFCDFSI